MATDDGPVWVKVTNPGQSFEGPLLQCLSALVPDQVLRPISVHPENGWLLLPHGGQTVKEVGPVTAPTWRALATQVAQLQVALMGYADTVLDTGLPVLLPGDAPEYVGSLVEKLAALPADHPQHVEAVDARTMLSQLSAVSRAWEALASHDLAMTLQPNDASPANAFVSTHGRPFRFFDLGDAFWSHPFAVLQVPSRFAAGSWPRPAPSDHPLVRILRRTYAQHFGVDLSGPDGAELFHAADRLASVHRCESWRRLLAPVDEARLDVPVPRLADWLVDALGPRT